jgi:hypothetical protein
MKTHKPGKYNLRFEEVDVGVWNAEFGLRNAELENGKGAFQMG